MSPYVKICCISSVKEAQTAMEFGAAALGLVSTMPSGPGVIDEAEICAIARVVPPPVSTFLLTASRTADEIIDQHARCGTTTLQLVDSIDSTELRKLRVSLPGIKLVQVIHVQGHQSVEDAITVASLVDALLLDSGNPNLEVKELGGTGRVHDWEISRRIRDSVQVPIFLAGGLNADNVRDAMNAVQPHGIDLCNGVRTNGVLDSEKLRTFMSTVREGS